MPHPFNSYETQRLIIRPTGEEDAAFILELLNSPKWKQNIGNRNVSNLEEAKTYIQTKCTPQFTRLGFGNYTVIRKSDQVKLGTCGLYDREGLDSIDIGFAFLPEHEKQGYAFESSSRILEAAVQDFNITTISAITIKENINSQRLLEKLGLQFEKIINIPNDEEDLMYYVLRIENEK